MKLSIDDLGFTSINVEDWDINLPFPRLTLTTDTLAVKLYLLELQLQILNIGNLLVDLEVTLYLIMINLSKKLLKELVYLAVL